MIIGILKEIKANEYRVACDPNGVNEIVNRGQIGRASCRGRV